MISHLIYFAKNEPEINTLRPRQNGLNFPDDIFKRIFLNENVQISIKISLEFVPKGPIDTSPALVQIMAWRRPGNKPLSEPMMVNILTHICITLPQWVQRVTVQEKDTLCCIGLWWSSQASLRDPNPCLIFKPTKKSIISYIMFLVDLHTNPLKHPLKKC